VTDII